MTFFWQAGQRPTAEEFGQFDTYDPELTAATTNPNLGVNGEAEGFYVRVTPRWVMGWATFRFAGTGVDAGSGIYRVSLPLPVDGSLYRESLTTSGLGSVLGTAVSRDDSTVGNSRTGLLQLGSASSGLVIILRNDESPAPFSNSVPFTWAAEDRLQVSFSYIPVAGT